MKKSMIVSTLVLSTTFTFAFDFGSIAKNVLENVPSTTQIITSTEQTKTTSQTTNKTSNLSNETVTSGLKEALKTGVTYATTQLGKDNGYLNNQAVKIPLPDNLIKAEALIRSAGGDKIADDLINSMNSAASKAAPKTAEIFMEAVDKMSVTDAQKILAGSNDAATQYFKTNTSESLKKAIAPIIKETMEENNVATYYNTANSLYKTNAKGLVENSSLMGVAKSFGMDSYLPTNSNESLDEFVTNKAIEGLFTMIAQKEAAIRANPVEQTSSILKEVFGN